MTREFLESGVRGLLVRLLLRAPAPHRALREGDVHEPE